MFGWTSRQHGRRRNEHAFTASGIGGLVRKEEYVTFRIKLFIVFTFALLLSVGLVAVGVTAVTRRAFDQLNHQYSDAAVAQFSREFARREQDVVHQVQGIADAEGTVRMAIDLSRPAGRCFHLRERRARRGPVPPARFSGFRQQRRLDHFLGGMVRAFRLQDGWVTQPVDWAALGSFLMKVDTPGGPGARR